MFKSQLKQYSNEKAHINMNTFMTFWVKVLSEKHYPVCVG